MTGTTIFAKFVDDSWHLVINDKPENAAFIITSHLCSPTSYATREERRTVQRWWQTNAPTISDWLNKHWHSELSTDEFFDHLRTNLLQA